MITNSSETEAKQTQQDTTEVRCQENYMQKHMCKNYV